MVVEEEEEKKSDKSRRRAIEGLWNGWPLEPTQPQLILISVAA